MTTKTRSSQAIDGAHSSRAGANSNGRGQEAVAAQAHNAPTDVDGGVQEDAESQASYGATIYDLVSEQCQRYKHRDNAAVAWRVLKEIDDGDIRELVLPLIIDQVVQTRRAMTRRAERAAFRGTSQPVNVTDGEYEPDVTALRKFLQDRRKFAIREGEVLWDEATEEQHLERIEMQEKHIRGVQDDIDRHWQAIQVMHAKGAKTLGEALS